MWMGWRTMDDYDWFASVREVTDAEAASGAFQITDVVLPLPGCKVIYSEWVKKLYEDMCKEDGVQLTGFAHSVREYSFGFSPARIGGCSSNPTKSTSPSCDILIRRRI